MKATLSFGSPDARGRCRNRVRLSHKAVWETRRALAEMHARAAVRDNLAADRPLATNEVADFGAHP
jgi:hypothetical protein